MFSLNDGLLFDRLAMTLSCVRSLKGANLLICGQLITIFLVWALFIGACDRKV